MFTVSGVYSITNNINNRSYIGSSNNVNKRRKTHISQLRNNKHPNKYLQNSWNKYGESVFDFKILEYVEDCSKLFYVEQTYIDMWNKKLLYNMANKAGGGGANVVRKPVFLLDLSGNILKEYESISAMCRLTGMSHSASMINTSSIWKSSYRVVQTSFYFKNLSTILSWKNYTRKKYLARPREILCITANEKSLDSPTFVYSKAELSRILGIHFNGVYSIINNREYLRNGIRQHKSSGIIIFKNNEKLGEYRKGTRSRVPLRYKDTGEKIKSLDFLLESVIFV